MTTTVEPTVTRSSYTPPQAPPAPVPVAQPTTPKPPRERLLSLDVFRGLTVAGMLLVNNPGTWAAIYPPLEHAVEGAIDDTHPALTELFLELVPPERLHR